MSSITLKDIAKALNISTSTVSRALRDSYDINIETKKKVVAYATQMNYTPNPIALSLKENKSRAIGVIVPEIANNFFSQAINGIEDIAYRRGYHVVIFQSHESYEREKSNVQHLYARKVDGLLISLSGTTQDTTHLEQLNNFPIVYFDRVPESENIHKVVVDNFEGAYKATEYLIQKGNTKIAHITSPPLLSITQERLAGYKAALQNYNLPFTEELVCYCCFDLEENENTILKVIENQNPDAYFMASDRLTLQAYQILKKFKVTQAPLFGFTNLNVTSLLEPPLRAVTQPAFKIGQESAQILLDEIENKNIKKEYKHLKLHTELSLITF